jgi:hypothetical protein
VLDAGLLPRAATRGFLGITHVIQPQINVSQPAFSIRRIRLIQAFQILLKGRDRFASGKMGGAWPFIEAYSHIGDRKVHSGKSTLAEDNTPI